MNNNDVAGTVISKLLDIVKDAETTINKMGVTSENPEVMMLGLEGVLKIGQGIQEVKNILNEARAEAAKKALEELQNNPNLSDDQKELLSKVINGLADADKDDKPVDEQEQRAIEAFNRIMNEAANKSQENQDGTSKD